MSSQHYRLLVVLGNLVLVAGIGYVGFRTYAGDESPERLTKWADLEKRMAEKGQGVFPTRYKIETDAGQRSSVEAFSAVWRALDRPEPQRAPVVAERPASERPVLRAQDLSTKYELVMVSANPEDPEGSSFVVQPRSGGRQQTLGVGEQIEGYTVRQIVVRGSDDDREAVVTVESPGGQQDTIKITRTPR